MRRPVLLTSFLSALVLSACGGGGGSSAVAPTPPPVSAAAPVPGITLVADLTPVFGVPPSGNETDSSMAMDKAGNVFISSTLNSFIARVTPGGVITTYAGIWQPLGDRPPFIDGDKASATLARPGALAFDPAGNLLVVDQGAIRRIAADGSIKTLPGTGVAPNYPYEPERGFLAGDIVFDKAGNLYAADSGYMMVRRIGADGAITSVAGHCIVVPYIGEGSTKPTYSCGANFTPVDGVGAAAYLSQPSRIGIDSNGNLVLADWYHLRRIVPATGQVSSLAGYGGPTTVRGFVDGPAATARFSTPTGFAADEYGNLYVADAPNNAIRKVTPDGTVSTVHTMGEKGPFIEDYGRGAPRRLVYLGNKSFYVLTDVALIKLVLP